MMGQIHWSGRHAALINAWINHSTLSPVINGIKQSFLVNKLTASWSEEHAMRCSHYLVTYIDRSSEVSLS